MARILVTGAAGFMGSHLFRLLGAEGRHTIEGWTRKMSTAPLGSGIYRQVDLLQAEQISICLSVFRPQWIFHFAGVNTGTRTELLAGNLQTTANLFNELKDQSEIQCVRLMAIGSAAEYGQSLNSGLAVPETTLLEPLGDYGHSKVEQWKFIERQIDNSVVETLYVRPFNVLGPGLGTNLVAGAWARQIAEMEAGRIPPVLRTGNLKSARDFVDVRDAVRAYRLLMERGEAGRVYNLASGVALPLEELLHIFKEKARTPFSVESVVAYSRGRDIAVACGDNTALQRATGWEPEVNIEASVGDLLDYWRAQVAAEINENITPQ